MVSLASIGNFFKQIGDALKKIPQGFKEIGNKFVEITNLLKDAFKKVFGVFKKLGGAFEKIGKGFKDSIEGVPKGLEYGFKDLDVFFKYIGEFLLGYIMCSIRMIENFHKCVFFYMMDMVGQFLYLPFRLALFLIWCIGFSSVYETEKMIWDIISDIDKIVFGITGYHFMHWPKSIRDLCYNCRRLKTNVIGKKANQMKDDWNGEIWKQVNKGGRELTGGFNDLFGAFTE